MSPQLEQQIRDYWDRQPCNILHSDKPVGTQEYFQEVTQRRYLVEPHIWKFAEFDQWSGRRVLEVGAGIGTDAEQFARHGADYTGIDVSETSLRICTDRFRVLNLSGKFLNINLLDDQHADLGKFDLVYSFGVLHHAPDIHRHLGMIADLLVPGGELRFMVYARNSWKSAMIDAGLDQFEAQTGCPWADRFAEHEVRDMLASHYTDIDIAQDHCFMYNVAAYRQGRHELEPWFAAMNEPMRQAVRKQLGWHLLVKAKKS